MTPVDAALTVVSMFVAGYYAKRMLEISQAINEAFPHLATELTILSVGLLVFAVLACLAANKARARERRQAEQDGRRKFRQSALSYLDRTEPHQGD